MRSSRTFHVAAAIAVCCLWAFPASAQVNFESIVQFGAQVQPVTVTQNAQFNGVGILQVGGTSASATVTQNGAGNYVGVLQFGGAATASVGQAGTVNFVFVGQSSGSTMAVSPLVKR
jgi:minor curlin subunit